MTTSSSLEDRLRDIILDRPNLLGRTPFLLAVSGGPDSMALLELFHQVSGPIDSLEIAVAYIEHDLRADGPAEERKFVRRMARSRGLPFQSGRVSIKKEAGSTGVSTEAAARRARYSKLKEISRKIDAGVLVTGHHRDDQLETIVLRLLRGTGIRGLRGMRTCSRLSPRKDTSSTGGTNEITLFRPLLDISSKQLEQYLNHRDIPFRRDSSNRNIAYRRNFVRHLLLPEIQSMLSHAYPDLLHQIRDRAVQIQDRLDQFWRNRNIGPIKYRDRLYYPASDVEDLPPMLYPEFLEEIRTSVEAQEQRPSYRDLERLKPFISAGDVGREETLSERVTIRREHGYYVVESNDGSRRDTVSVSRRVDPPDLVGWKGHSIEMLPLSVRSTDSLPADTGNNPTREVFDRSRTTGVLRVGDRRPGDQMQIIGMEGRKKVKDLMIDRNIPRSLRSYWPVLRDRHGPFLIPGLAISQRVALRSGTEHASVVQLEWKPPRNSPFYDVLADLS